MSSSPRIGVDWSPASIADAAIALLGLLWLTGTLQSSLPSRLASEHAAVRWGIELLRVAVYGFSSALLLCAPRRLLDAARRAWPLLLVAALAAASTLWSIRPGVTLRGSAWLAATTAFGIFFGMRFDAQRQLRLLGVALGIAALGSLVVALALPDHGVTQDSVHRGAWMGIYRHKNLLARDMALAVAVFAMLARSRLLPPVVAWSFAALGAALIAASGSRTGALVAAATTAAALHWTADASADRGRWRWWIGAAAGLCLAIALSHSTPLDWLGRDETLSGRTQLWSVVAERIADRPWLGYGYDAFWVRSIAEGGPAVEVAAQIDWLARHAHNGFLEVALDLGAVGLALFAAPLLVFSTRLIRSPRPDGAHPACAWPALFAVFWILSNLTESPLVRHDQLGWALYAAAVARTPAAFGRGPRGAGSA